MPVRHYETGGLCVVIQSNELSITGLKESAEEVGERVCPGPATLRSVTDSVLFSNKPCVTLPTHGIFMTMTV